jgi:hypothetical protein
MKLRLQLVCHDCPHPGATDCRDGSPPFVTDPLGNPLEFNDERSAVAEKAKHLGGMGVRILTWQEPKGWTAFIPTPAKKSVLD